MTQPLWTLPQTSVAVHASEQRFPVRRVYCVGRNYVDHIREMKEGDERDDPFFFQKPADAVVCTGDSVPYPPFTDGAGVRGRARGGHRSRRRRRDTATPQAST